MKELGSKENNSIYVGDSGSDMLTAQNAHIKVLALLGDLEMLNHF